MRDDQNKINILQQHLHNYRHNREFGSFAGRRMLASPSTPPYTGNFFSARSTVLNQASILKDGSRKLLFVLTASSRSVKNFSARDVIGMSFWACGRGFGWSVKLVGWSLRGCGGPFWCFSVTVVSDRNTAVRMGHAKLSSCLASWKIQAKRR